MKKYFVFVGLCFWFQCAVPMEGDDGTDEIAQSDESTTDTDDNERDDIDDDQEEADSEAKAAEEEISKKAYVKSLVDNILKIKQGTASRKEVDASVKKQIARIQRELDDLSKNLAVNSSSDNGNKKKNSKGDISKKKRTKSRIRKRRHRKSSRSYLESGYRKDFYTVKSVDPFRSQKYTPKRYYRESSSETKCCATAAPAPRSSTNNYVIKNWGSGQTFETNSTFVSNQRYFSTKSGETKNCAGRCS